MASPRGLRREVEALWGSSSLLQEFGGPTLVSGNWGLERYFLVLVRWATAVCLLACGGELGTGVPSLEPTCGKGWLGPCLDGVGEQCWCTVFAPTRSSLLLWTQYLF